MTITISELKTKGSVSLPYPADLRSAVVATVESWKKFCALSTVEKKKMPHDDPGIGVGYELKDGSGNYGDRKENFDVAIADGVWHNAGADKIVNPIALEFVERAIMLVSILKPLIIDFARQSEEAFGLDGFVDEVAQSENVFFIRFIHYFGDRAVGDEIASAHVDQSGFTLHLYESAPGLQCLTFDSEWVDMPVSDGETVIIPGMQLQLRSQGKLKALCHRVIATPETAKDGRYSVVCFVQLKKAPKYDRKVQGRLQEKVPGFNYDISLDAFSKLFVK